MITHLTLCLPDIEPLKVLSSSSSFYHVCSGLAVLKIVAQL